MLNKRQVVNIGRKPFELVPVYKEKIVRKGLLKGVEYEETFLGYLLKPVTGRPHGKRI